MKNFFKIVLFGFAFAAINYGQNLFKGVSLSLNTVLLNLFGGILIALLFSWLFPKITLRKTNFILVLAFAIFIIQIFSNMLEGAFFTTHHISLVQIITALIISLLEAIIAVYLFSAKSENSFCVLAKSYFQSRKWFSWIWRIILAAVSYTPIYFLFGMLVAPFVIPIYKTHPELVIPPFSVIIPLELLRGLIYTLALLPLFATINANKKTLIFAIALLLYIPGAFVPLLTAPLPKEIVPFHMIEILGDSLVFALVTSKLLRRNA